MQPELCLENHTQQNLLALEVNPEVLPEQPLPVEMEGSEADQRKGRWKGRRKTTHPIYGIWEGMNSRCNSINDDRFPDYGGRGIKICKRWGNFWAFVQDMGDRPSPKHTLERINNNGNYEPSNCRWATKLEQSRNTRRNKFLEYNGKSLTISEWSRELGIDRATIIQRMNRGWTVAKTVTEPKHWVGAAVKKQ